MGGRGSSGGSGAGGAIATGERDLNFSKVGSSFSKLSQNLKYSINNNMKMSSTMKNDIKNGRKNKMTDEWITGIGSNKIKVVTSVKSDKLCYTIKKGNKILLATNSKEQAANKVAAFYLGAMKKK